MNPQRNRFCLVLFLTLGLVFWFETGGVTAYAGEDLEITAGRAEFDPKTRIFTGSEGVEIKGSDLLIRAGEVTYDQEGWIKATGGVELILPAITLEGEHLLYNIPARAGEITEFTGRTEGTFFHGSRGEITGRGLSIKNAAVTRCSLPVPDLEFTAGELKMEEDMVKMSGGWLRLKGFRFLPLPPLAFSLKRMEQWPSLRAGIDPDWKIYLSGSMRYPFWKQFAVSAGATVGTGGRLGLAAGLHWYPDEALKLEAGYTWNNQTGEKMVYSFNYAGARAQFLVEITNNREEGETPGRGDVRAVFPLAPQVTGELFWRRDYLHDLTGFSSLSRPHAESCGVRMRKEWFPQFVAGVGLIHGWGDWEEEFLPGWQVETSLQGRILQTGGWALALEGAYMWGREEGLWTAQKIEVIRDLHCFEAGLSYDLLKEETALRLDLTW